MVCSYVDSPPVIVIGGPTGSGKTSASLELAKQIDGEIVSADSMQIYKYLDVGTAKATPEEQSLVRHHLIDVKEPWERFSVADYQAAALAAIADIRDRGKWAIVCGGTGQYISALIDGLTFVDMPFDAGLRDELSIQASNPEGLADLLEELKTVDPIALERIHPHNVKRIIRAVEVHRLTGKTQTQLNKDSRAGKPTYNYQLFIISHDRSKLYERIHRRIDQMISAGLLEETAQLMEMELPEDSTCLQAIGYKEMIPYLKGEMTLEQGKELLARNTRRYAKRQLTWFRRQTPQGLWLNNMSPQESAETIRKYLAI
ncbi:MAG: tRNA (adenosine(37)-N6)-dimethylallyltransferase MiaA [Fastidiosipilaceae bacterium]|jgi:tRNA dimethylallyltransferase|nr:tRNA (adenosine(37)-N6)-dimethylallyltransferase MiaA [Clostridiaceae bacterium]